MTNVTALSTAGKFERRNTLYCFSNMSKEAIINSITTMDSSAQSWSAPTHDDNCILENIEFSAKSFKSSTAKCNVH